jgi:hypothetical protein
MSRPAVAWLQRARYHLEHHKSQALAANDVADFVIDAQCLKFLDVFTLLAKRDELRLRRRSRAEVLRLRAINQNDERLQEKLRNLPFAA